MKRFRASAFSLLVGLALVALLCGAAGALLATCGPFTDTAADAFCPFVLEVFYLGITTGTTPTTYDPASSVSRLQMAAFLSRGVDGVIRRVSRRAAIRQFWTPTVGDLLPQTSLASPSNAVESDGTDVWVTVPGSNSISRVRGSDGKLLENWTGATNPVGIAVALGRIFVTGNFGTGAGKLYRIDPSQPAGAVTTVATNLGGNTQQVAFDGTRIWTANDTGGSVSLVTPSVNLPWTVTTVLPGLSGGLGILYDGTNIWVTDVALRKLDSAGTILQTVTTGSAPGIPVFDGTNIWVPNQVSNSVTVVRASNGSVLATLTGNGLSEPSWAAFDGQRVLVTSPLGDRVSLYKAADLTSLGNFGTGSDTMPVAAASDGLNFWIAMQGTSKLARF